MCNFWTEFDKKFLNAQKNIRFQKEDKIKIAFVDTGCDIHNAFFKDFSIQCIDVDYKKAELDYCGHGTFFASVLCRYLLLHKENVEIISIKASDSHQIATENLCKGVEIAINEGVDVLNIGACNSNYDIKMARLIKKAVDRGIIVTAPAGNNVKGVNIYPASLSTVISCAALDCTGNIADFSNVNDSTDIAIPGEYIHGIMALEHAEKMKLAVDKNNMVICSGTSFAAGILAGAVVSIKLVDRSITYKQFRNILHTLNKIESNVYNCSINIPVIDLEKILENIGKYQSNNNQNVDSMHWYVTHMGEHKIKAEVFDDFGNRMHNFYGIITIRLYKYVCKYKQKESSVVAEEIVDCKNGEFTWHYSGNEAGIYLLEIADKDNRVKNAFTMMQFIPPKPLVKNIMDEGDKIIIKLAEQNKYDAYYSFDNDGLKIDFSQKIKTGTYKYESRIEMSYKDHKYVNIANFSEGIFGEMLRIDIRNKKIL